MTDLDLQEQIARIARAQAETYKFSAEQRKLTAEGMKFERERVTACHNLAGADCHVVAESFRSAGP